MASQAALPDLRRIDIASLKGMPKPVQKIRFDSDVEVWRTTRSYQDYSLFLHRLTEAVVGQYLPLTNSTQSSARRPVALVSFVAALKPFVGYLGYNWRFGSPGSLDRRYSASR